LVLLPVIILYVTAYNFVTVPLTDNLG